MTSLLSHIDHESGAGSEPQLPAPAKTVSRNYPGGNSRSNSVELQRLPTNGADQDPPTGASTPREERDLEMSRPSTPRASVHAVDTVPSVWQPYMNRFRLPAMCLAILGNGLSDSAAGALIPYMET